MPIGLLAFVAGEVAGWTRVVPRSALPGIAENRALARLLDDADDAADAWWVPAGQSCGGPHPNMWSLL
ncbi:hypothetical protein EB834_07275 [Brevibacterium aurantiacum]|uniref:Uncharacterized protein n=1 Tax=Brevibacterium aurantiacum TaxID=273384 RepID=A0A4Z0KKW0_BREAU|nr:hypothetical protein EB834_07275 [Brevibacterium aurantiacum]